MTNKFGSGISKQLKLTVMTAFKQQRDFAEQFQQNFPILQEKLTDLAYIQSGQALSVDNLDDLAKDLATIIETLQLLTDKGREAIAEADIASMKLKEIEDDPAEIVEDLVSVAMILANIDIWMQTSTDFVSKMLEIALPKIRQESLSRLTEANLIIWANDITKEIARRNE